MTVCGKKYGQTQSYIICTVCGKAMKRHGGKDMAKNMCCFLNCSMINMFQVIFKHWNSCFMEQFRYMVNNNQLSHRFNAHMVINNQFPFGLIARWLFPQLLKQKHNQNAHMIPDKKTESTSSR